MRMRLWRKTRPLSQACAGAVARFSSGRSPFPSAPTWSVRELKVADPPELPAETLRHVARLSRLDVDEHSKEGRLLRRQLGAILATARKVAAVGGG